MSSTGSGGGFHPPRTSGEKGAANASAGEHGAWSKSARKSVEYASRFNQQPTSPIRGLLFALPFSALLWVLIVWGVRQLGGK